MENVYALLRILILFFFACSRVVYCVAARIGKCVTTLTICSIEFSFGTISNHAGGLRSLQLVLLLALLQVLLRVFAAAL